MQIDPYSPEVIREYESEIKALKARGEDTTRLEENPEMGYKKIAEETSKQLYEEYKHIVDLINGLDMEPAFKSMMLRETLTKVYKLDKDNKSNGQKTIIKNRDMKKSIGGHMILNEQTLKFIYENVKNIEEYKNFANLYFAAVEVYKDTIASKSGIMLDGVDTYGKGKWIKFEGKNTNPEEYLKNASELAALVQDTPWCTKQLASSQLAEGDFYVFVDNTGKPHIAVKTRGDTIDEVRGIKNGNAQELEEEYRDVAISFLENNKDIENGKEWLEKEEWNKRLIEYARKIDNGEFKVEDVPKFIEDYLKKDYRNQGGENSNKKALKDRLEKIKGVVAEYYSCSEEEITFGDVNFAETQLTTVPYKIIFGDADFRGSQIKNLGSLRSIGGNAYITGPKIKSLGLLESIGGYACFGGSQVEDLGSLRSIGGNCFFTSLNTVNPPTPESNIPIGSKSKESIIELTKQGIEFLIGQNVKLIVIACGTATSQALEEVKKIYSIPIIGIINSTVEYLEHKYRDKEPQIGVIATKGTIRSNGWQNKIELLMPKAKIKTMGCPLLAPMAEEGWTDNKIAELTVKEYLKNIKNVDALILGCTHYPLFQKIIKREMGRGVEIINTGEKIAQNLTTYLQENNINSENKGQDIIYLTDTECNFIHVAEKLLGDKHISEKVQKADYLKIIR